MRCCTKCGKNEYCAKGLCRKCYNKAWKKANPEKCKAQWTRDDRKRGCLPMSENKSCSMFLGVHVAERVLRNVFKNVTQMPHGNTGFDFICNHGKKIDVKSSSTRNQHSVHSWHFHIRKNDVADFFLCIAFNNRIDLSPMHLWLIPGYVVNHLETSSISASRINKWDEYKLDINKVIACCDTMKVQ